MLCLGDVCYSSIVIHVSPPGVKMAIKSKQAEHYFLYMLLPQESIKRALLLCSYLCWISVSLTLGLAFSYASTNATDKHKCYELVCTKIRTGILCLSTSRSWQRRALKKGSKCLLIGGVQNISINSKVSTSLTHSPT